MVREERTIEVTLISATDLKKVKKFGREQKNYVSAYIYPARRQTTGADPYGGVNPIWNCTLKLNCYDSDLHPVAATSNDSRPAASSSSETPSAHEMTLEIYSHGGGLFHTADKLVGTVIVPLQQVASAAAGGTLPPFDVHLPTESSGQVQGSLNLSVKLGAKRELGDYEDLATTPLSSYSDQGAASSIYPPGGDKVPSTQTSDYNSRGQSSYSNYPPTSDYTLPAPNQNTSATEDFVTGYPDPGYYAFAPLGQLPVQSLDQPRPISVYRPCHHRPCHQRPCHQRPCHQRPCHQGPCHQGPCHQRPCHQRKWERRELKRERKRQRRMQKRTARACMDRKQKAHRAGMIALHVFFLGII